MAFNISGAQSIPLGVFGGLVTEMAPTALPEGCSPDNKEMMYLPGSAYSRSCFQKVFENPFPAGGPNNFIPTVVYGKSLVTSSGDIKNLFFDSNGILWVEDWTNSPGSYTQLFAATPGSQCTSITAFGREYIAISDGLHGTWPPLQYDGTNLDRLTQDAPGAPPTVANLVYAAQALASVMSVALTRANNLVFGTTSAAHNLQVGYQALVADVTASQIGGGIATVVIDNEDLPGIATITTNTAHGLAPGEYVFLDAIPPNALTIATFSYINGVADIVTTADHNLSVGSLVNVALGSTGVLIQQTVISVISATEFTCPTDTAGASSGTGGTVQYVFPLANASTSTTNPALLNTDAFEVIECPSATSFQVAVTYTDGTWSGGTVSYQWNGTFLVTAVPSTTEFVYQQPGPNITTDSSGTITPFGQAAPGLHLCQVLFLDRQGGITAPSPPTTFIANGGQYVSVSNIPIGPPNIVARILAFTGAQPNVPGILPPFFYLAGPAQLEGQVVSTGTQINDNTTTSILLDFSDDSLFGTAAEGGAISVTGNNLANQIVLDGALAFAYFESRLSTIGQRATVQELLNLGFEGGVFSGSATQPLGWTGSGGALAAGLTGLGKALTGGTYSQSGYLDASGAPIFEGNVLYAVRAMVRGTGNVTITLSSASTSFSATATLAASATAAYVQVDFSLTTPDSIPSDFTLTIAQPTATIDEISFFDSQNPYLDNQTFTSYTNNPAGMDGVSGNGQPTEDTHKIMGFSVIRGTPYAVTQDPSGRVHEILINPTSEPSGWTWKEIQANCGSLSAFGITHSQADDETASSGDDWSAWPTETGAGLFDGAQVHKVSQEIQPNWNPGNSKYPWMAPGTAINMNAATLISALCDPVDRMLYFFVPVGISTGTTAIYALSFRELNSAYAIANSPPIHVSLSGKLVVTDNTRKWMPWERPMNGAARMYRSGTGTLTTVFFGGNGLTAGSAAGYGNVYILNPAKLTDDDYGQIYPYYVTFYGPDAEKAQALQITALRKLLAYVTPYISGVGQVTYSVLCDAPTNIWPLTAIRTLTTNPKFAQEFAGCQALGSRMALRIAVSPITGTDVSFNLQWLNFYYKNAKLGIRGAAR